jgi:hypothetical protein
MARGGHADLQPRRQLAEAKRPPASNSVAAPLTHSGHGQQRKCLVIAMGVSTPAFAFKIAGSLNLLWPTLASPATH